MDAFRWIHWNRLADPLRTYGPCRLAGIRQCRSIYTFDCHGVIRSSTDFECDLVLAFLHEDESTVGLFRGHHFLGNHLDYHAILLHDRCVGRSTFHPISHLGLGRIISQLLHFEAQSMSIDRKMDIFVTYLLGWMKW